MPRIGICPRCKKKEKISDNCYIHRTRCEECFEKDLKKIKE